MQLLLILLVVLGKQAAANAIKAQSPTERLRALLATLAPAGIQELRDNTAVESPQWQEPQGQDLCANKSLAIAANAGDLSSANLLLQCSMLGVLEANGEPHNLIQLNLCTPSWRKRLSTAAAAGDHSATPLLVHCGIMDIYEMGGNSSDPSLITASLSHSLEARYRCILYIVYSCSCSCSLPQRVACMLSCPIVSTLVRHTDSVLEVTWYKLLSAILLSSI